MQLPLYHIDAFSANAFGGNPAAVCPLPSWIDDRLMQSIAAENNLAETAFFAPSSVGYDIRWFTPTDEVDLCGHATLASAHVVFEHLARGSQSVTFGSKSGEAVDFVSRFFAPRVGVPEDPATGSAHCTLTPYWAARLGKRALHARQVSARGGELWCERAGERVKIGGHVKSYLAGRIDV